MGNERLMAALKRCPICGAMPKIGDCYDVDKDNYVKYEKHCYKLMCSACALHISCGDWFDSKYAACKDWNRRTEDKTQADYWKPKRTGWILVDEELPTEEAWYHVLIRYQNREQGRVEYTIENDLYAIALAERYGHPAGFCKARRWKEREQIVAWCRYPMIPEELTRDATKVIQPYKEEF